MTYIIQPIVCIELATIFILDIHMATNHTNRRRTLHTVLQHQIVDTIRLCKCNIDVYLVMNIAGEIFVGDIIVGHETYHS